MKMVGKCGLGPDFPAIFRYFQWENYEKRQVEDQKWIDMGGIQPTSYGNLSGEEMRFETIGQLHGLPNCETDSNGGCQVLVEDLILFG